MKNRAITLGVLLALCLASVMGSVRGALAHPLGNFTINHFARVEAYADAVRVHWVLDMAEIPTFQEMSSIDADGDGVVSDTERDSYVAAVLPRLLPDLLLEVDGTPRPLAVLASDLALVEAQAGLQTLRLTLDLQTSTTVGDGTVTFSDSTFADRIGWREMVVTAGTGVPTASATVPAQSVSDELRAYPDDLLSSPLDVRVATFGYRAGIGESAPPLASETSRAEESATGGPLDDLLGADELTLPIIALAMLLAFGLGAVHALSPGHGKTIVAAYFVGSGGTPGQALFLALTVTLAHTVGVLALGAVTLWASAYVVPEDLYPTLTLGSGLVLIGFGGVMLHRWWRSQRRTLQPDQDPHPHTHDHAGDEARHHHGHDHERLSPLDHARAHLAGRTAADGLPWRSLLTLGISGGILPSPTALIVLLGAISLHRFGFGLVLILMFSLGLASVLTGVGMAFVVARRLFDRVRPGFRLLPYAPALAAVGIAFSGGVLAARGLLAI